MEIVDLPHEGVDAENRDPNTVCSPLVITKQPVTPADSVRDENEQPKKKKRKANRSAESLKNQQEVNREKGPKHAMCTWLKDKCIIRDFKDMDGLEVFVREVTAYYKDMDEWKKEQQEKIHSVLESTFHESLVQHKDVYERASRTMESVEGEYRVLITERAETLEAREAACDAHEKKNEAHENRNKEKEEQLDAKMVEREKQEMTELVEYTIKMRSLIDQINLNIADAEKYSMEALRLEFALKDAQDQLDTFKTEVYALRKKVKGKIGVAYVCEECDRDIY